MNTLQTKIHRKKLLMRKELKGEWKEWLLRDEQSLKFVVLLSKEEDWVETNMWYLDDGGRTLSQIQGVWWEAHWKREVWLWINYIDPRERINLVPVQERQPTSTDQGILYPKLGEQY